MGAILFIWYLIFVIAAIYDKDFIWICEDLEVTLRDSCRQIVVHVNVIKIISMLHLRCNLEPNMSNMKLVGIVFLVLHGRTLPQDLLLFYNIHYGFLLSTNINLILQIHTAWLFFSYTLLLSKLFNRFEIGVNTHSHKILVINSILFTQIFTQFLVWTNVHVAMNKVWFDHVTC